jgi:integrase
MKHIKANFKLKEPGASIPTLIYLKAYHNHQRFTYSTGRKIHPQYWHEGSQRPITYRLELLKKEVKTSADSDLKTELSLLQSLIKQGKAENPVFMTEMSNIAADLNNIEQELLSAFEYLIRQKEVITPLRLKEWMDDSFMAEKTIQSPESDFYRRFEEFLESRIKSVSVLTSKKFNTLKTRLKEFEKDNHYKITFDSIDLVFYDKFKDFLLSKKIKRSEEEETGLLNDSISKYFATIKTFMQWSLDRNYHSNTTFKHNQFSAKKKSKNEIVTLSSEELMRIYELDLSDNPYQEKVRDLFCFAAFTGQRWSDVEQFRKEDVRDGWWIFESKKTKETMRIPFTGFTLPALEILKKYDFDLPVLIQQTFNKEIKNIGGKAEITEPVTLVRYSGSKKIINTKPKNKFMTSHMARRSCVTILLQRGVPATTVMKLTGHKDLKTLMRYENTSEGALAEALKNM